MDVRVTSNLLCNNRWGWLWTADLPASASHVFRLEAKATMPSRWDLKMLYGALLHPDVCGSLRGLPRLLLRLMVWDRVSHQTWNSSFLLDQLAWEPLKSACLFSPVLVLQVCMARLSFYVGDGDLNSCPYACLCSRCFILKAMSNAS